MPMERILYANGEDSICQWGGFYMPVGRILNVSGEDSKCQWGGL